MRGCTSAGAAQARLGNFAQAELSTAEAAALKGDKKLAPKRPSAPSNPSPKAVAGMVES